jgi:hypothetical protein
MRRKAVLGVCLTLGMLALSLLVLGGQAVQAKQNSKPAKGADGTETVVTATGKLVAETAGGERQYTLQDSSGKKLYYLEVGPRWFYSGTVYPLDKYANQQVTVTGEVDGPNSGKGPNANANPRTKENAKARPDAPADAPTLEVFTINNETLRAPGKPPWAGGPKNVPNHPGNKGKGHGKAKGNNGKGSGKNKGTQNKP